SKRRHSALPRSTFRCPLRRNSKAYSDRPGKKPSSGLSRGWAEQGTHSHPTMSDSTAKSAITPDRWAQIKLFAMDVDGVLTDGTVQIASDGTEAKSFSILDGLGLKRLEKAGIVVAWISGRASGATTARATELKIPHLLQGRTDKITALQELALKLALSPEQCA